MLLRLVVAPDKTLREVSRPVVIGDEQDESMLRSVLDSMVETCRHMGGLSLSAVQVGVPSRLFVIVNDQDAMYFVNPVITEIIGDEEMVNEGCLSFPGVYGGISRSSIVHMKYQNYDLQDCVLEAKGAVARAILHEMDHLDGKLFVDHMRSVARDVANRKSLKTKKLIKQTILRQAAEGK